MITSMTGYATCTDNLKSYSLTCKIKTLNHRYLDVEVYLPVNDYDLESSIVSDLKETLDRGKVIVNFELQENGFENEYILDKVLLQKYMNIVQEAEKIVSRPELLKIIFSNNNFQDLIKQVPTNNDALSKDILNIFSKSLKKLIATRKSEGKVLSEDIKSRLKKMGENLGKIKKHKKDHLKSMEKIFREKLETLDQEISSQTKSIIDFELNIIAEKSDITEEIVRAEYHIKSFLKSLNGKDEVSGKKLEFISQELLREVNTIASKSANISIRSNVILIKEQIEKIRQQLRNVE